MNRLKGKVAVVTGASKGIGAAIAEHLAAEGASVVVNYASSKSGADAIVKRITQKEGKAVAVQADVSKAEDIQRLFAETKKAFGKLDILVNNAGIYAAGSASNTTRETLRELFETNVFGVVSVTNAFLPLLRKADAARIVNVSSEVASLGIITDPTSFMWGMQDLAYQASKGAVNWVTIMFAKELADTPIKVNAAIPGYVSTDLNGNTGYITAAQGAEASVALATLPDDGPTGTFWGTLTSIDSGDKTNAPW